MSVVTFNHAPYIEEAMNGFTMQETNFPFVCAIVDDASTDGEREVIKQYLNDLFDLEDKKVARHEETDDYVLTFARHKTNINCHFAVLTLKYNHYGTKQLKARKAEYVSEWRDKAKYIAICEGDDYWTDPRKLQKQVDFLDKHEGYGMVYTSYKLQNDVTGVATEMRASPHIPHDENFKWRILDQQVTIGTCTTLLRYRLYQEIRSIKDDFKGNIGDTPRWFNAARLSRVGYLPEVTGVYRKNVTGVTAIFEEGKRTISFIKNCLELDLYLANKYHAPEDVIVRIKSIFGFSLIRLYIKQRLFQEAWNVNKNYFDNSKTIAFIINTYSFLRFLPTKGVGMILDMLWKIGLIKIK